MSFTKFLNFVGLCLVAIVFLVIGSVHVVWSPPGQAPGVAFMVRLQLPIGRNEDGDTDPQTKASFGRWLQQVAVAAYGEKTKVTLIDHLTHPQANVDYDVPRYRVTLSSVGRRLMHLVRVGPFLPLDPFEPTRQGIQLTLPPNEQPNVPLPTNERQGVFPSKKPNRVAPLPLLPKPWLAKPSGPPTPTRPVDDLPSSSSPQPTSGGPVPPSAVISTPVRPVARGSM
jgi:hypothetical protein